MASEDRSSVHVGPTLPGLLFVLFVALKLLGKIDWSWWWVCSPLWIPPSVWLVVVVGLVWGAARKSE